MGLNDLIKIGDRIKIYRKNLNLTQIEMADKLRLPRSTYAHYENNTREPKGETLNKIAEALGVTISDLMGLEADFSRSTSLSNLYYKSVMKWSEDKFFKPLETVVIREHLSETLLLYKELIESLAYKNSDWDDEKERYLDFYKNTKNPSTNEEWTEDDIKIIFLNKELEKDIKKLTARIQSFPLYFVRYQKIRD